MLDLVWERLPAVGTPRGVSVSAPYGQRKTIVGFPSDSLGRPRPQGSVVFQWAERRWKHLRRQREFTPEWVFGCLVYSVSRFIEPRPEQGRSEEDRALGPLFEAHYGNDSALFELGCYAYFRLDLWLFRERPGLRQGLSAFLADEFVKLFTEALGVYYVQQLLSERVGRYGEIANCGGGPKEYHSYLIQLLLAAKDNRKPRLYGDVELLVLDIERSFMLTAKLMTWEEFFLPTLTNGLEQLRDGKA